MHPVPNRTSRDICNSGSAYHWAVTADLGEYHVEFHSIHFKMTQFCKIACQVP